MTRPLPSAAPDTQPHDPAPSRCSRSCCWTPYVCARGYDCRCHKGDTMAKGPNHPPAWVKRQVIERDGGFCLLTLRRCTGEAQTTDHRANRGAGGSRLLNDPRNLIAACSICNGDKADGRSMVLMGLERRGLYVRPDATHEKTLARAVRTPVESLDGRWWMLVSATERIEVPAPAEGYL